VRTLGDDVTAACQGKCAGVISKARSSEPIDTPALSATARVSARALLQCGPPTSDRAQAELGPSSVPQTELSLKHTARATEISLKHTVRPTRACPCLQALSKGRTDAERDGAKLPAKDMFFTLIGIGLSSRCTTACVSDADSGRREIGPRARTRRWTAAQFRLQQ